MKYSKEEKAMWVEDWKVSGKSAWSYALENGLSPQTFSNWVKKEEEIKSCFVEVAAPETQASEILIEKGDVKIHIPLAVGNTGLRAVIESLEAAL